MHSVFGGQGDSSHGERAGKERFFNSIIDKAQISNNRFHSTVKQYDKSLRKRNIVDEA